MVFSAPISVGKNQSGNFISQPRQPDSNSNINSASNRSTSAKKFEFIRSQSVGLIIMAESSSWGSTSISDVTRNTSSASSPSTTSKQGQTRSRPKLGRASTSTSWFAKSVDQATIRQESKPSKHPSLMRRQNSVSDFFQSVLWRGKNNIAGIFSGKKGKSKETISPCDSASTGQKPCPVLGSAESLPESLPIPIRPGLVGSQRASGDGGVNSPSLVETCTVENLGNNLLDSLSKETPGSFHSHDSHHSPTFIISPNVGLSGSHTTIDKEARSSSSSQISLRKSQTDLTSDSTQTHNMPKSNQISSFSALKKIERSSSISPKTKRPNSTSRKQSVQSQPSRERQSSLDTGDEFLTSKRAVRSISSAPAGRASVCAGPSSSLMVRDAVHVFKCALVKSNSETFAKGNVDQIPLAKASSDGNCFTAGVSISIKSQSAVISRITNYLFLGSVEAAYSEPLLCKYDITSLIDMTNTPAIQVPIHKKTDCPCACIGKTHFRSKLNIGIDDIEWENLEQYYGVINTFINGARKKGGRILIFSYMGQSRAAAATIQHLMFQYKIPYMEAFHIVKSKRPQTKINSGFVKALCRLEKTLGLVVVPDNEISSSSSGDKKHAKLSMFKRQKSEDVVGTSRSAPNSSSSNSSGGGGSDTSENQLDSHFPHVVRGAWLEC